MYVKKTKSSTQKKKRTLTVELHNGCNIIFTMLDHKLSTNNESESALRHWVFCVGFAIEYEPGKDYLFFLFSRALLKHVAYINSVRGDI